MGHNISKLYFHWHENNLKFYFFLTLCASYLLSLIIAHIKNKSLYKWSYYVCFLLALLISQIIFFVILSCGQDYLFLKRLDKFGSWAQHTRWCHSLILGAMTSDYIHLFLHNDFVRTKMSIFFMMINNLFLYQFWSYLPL